MIDFTQHKTGDGNYIWRYDGSLPEFNAAETVDALTRWIREFFESTSAKIAVIGISGGKDSSVVAALCARALGPENVIGVTMPDGGQSDWRDQADLIKHLDIRHIDFDIGQITQAVRDTAAGAHIATPGWCNESDNDVPEAMWDVPEANKTAASEADSEDDFGILANAYELPRQAATNMPARIRMTVLYMVAQSLREPARVAGTCNLSENWIGWETRYGDGASDFCPISSLTASEICLVGRYLGLPAHLIEKAPADGLTDKDDEDNFGFTYDDLDLYIRIGRNAEGQVSRETMDKIDEMHARNGFKMHMPPAFQSGQPIMAGGTLYRKNLANEGDDRATDGDKEDLMGNGQFGLDDSDFPSFTKTGEPIEHGGDDGSVNPLAGILRRARKREKMPVREMLISEKPDYEPKSEDGRPYRDDMEACPNCRTSDHLHIKGDLVSLNALEYWVECAGCGEQWTDRMLGTDYAETPEELVELWNATMGA